MDIPSRFSDKQPKTTVTWLRAPRYVNPSLLPFPGFSTQVCFASIPLGCLGLLLKNPVESVFWRYTFSINCNKYKSISSGYHSVSMPLWSEKCSYIGWNKTSSFGFIPLCQTTSINITKIGWTVVQSGLAYWTTVRTIVVHGRNLVGDTGDVCPPFFRRGDIICHVPPEPD